MRGEVFLVRKSAALLHRAARVRTAQRIFDGENAVAAVGRIRRRDSNYALTPGDSQAKSPFIPVSCHRKNFATTSGRQFRVAGTSMGVGVRAATCSAAVVVPRSFSSSSSSSSSSASIASNIRARVTDFFSGSTSTNLGTTSSRAAEINNRGNNDETAPESSTRSSRLCPKTGLPLSEVAGGRSLFASTSGQHGGQQHSADRHGTIASHSGLRSHAHSNSKAKTFTTPYHLHTRNYNNFLDIPELQRPADFPKLAQAVVDFADEEMKELKRVNQAWFERASSSEFLQEQNLATEEDRIQARGQGQEQDQRNSPPLSSSSASQPLPPMMSTKTLLRTLDNVSASLCNIADAAELTRNVTPPDSKWHDAANDAVNLIAQYMSVVNLDEEVFEILKKHHELRLLKRNDIIKCDSGAGHLDLSERPTSSTPPCPSDEALSLEEATVFRHMVESMGNEGVGMPPEKKEECLALQQTEQELSFCLAGGISNQNQQSGNSSAATQDGQRNSSDFWISYAELEKRLEQAAAAASPSSSAEQLRPTTSATPGRDSRNHFRALLPYLEQRDSSTSGSGKRYGFFSRGRNTTEENSAKNSDAGGGREINLGGERMRENPALADVVLKTCPIEQAREKIFQVVHIEENPELERALVELLLTRTRLAQLRDYENWNVYAQRDGILNFASNSTTSREQGENNSSSARADLSISSSKNESAEGGLTRQEHDHGPQTSAAATANANVTRFLEKAWAALLPGLKKELRQLAEMKYAEKMAMQGRSQNIKDSDSDFVSLNPWDIAYFVEKSKTSVDNKKKKAAYNITSTTTYDSLISGVNLILQKFLHVNFTEVTPHKNETWHASVRKFELRREGTTVAREATKSETDEEGSSSLIGILYIDALPRPEKRVQSAQFTLQGSREVALTLSEEDASTTSPHVVQHQEEQTAAANTTSKTAYVIPKTALVCSIPEKNISRLAAITFFHEVGHCVHSLLSKTQLQSLSGTRGAVDFVEFPSHLFEYFVLDEAVMRKWSGQGEGAGGGPQPGQTTIPRDAQDIHISEISTETAFPFLEACQQLLFALVDQKFYDCGTEISSVEDMREKLSAGLLDSLPDLGKHVALRRIIGGAGAGRTSNGSEQADENSCRAPKFELVLTDEALENDNTLQAPRTLRNLLTPMPLSKFEHLVHYGGSYYCYLLNKVLACHVWRNSGFARLENGERLKKFMETGSVHGKMDSILRLLDGNEASTLNRAGEDGRRENDTATRTVDFDAFLDTYVKELNAQSTSSCS
ncbi:unnamed protein product [Amoebophrya sp. A120]|nr:unnamed protein product [Amoebophrya sp. A120]|eukprot:GSA120T00009355001.1